MLEFTVLGTITASRAGDDVDLGSPQQRSVLALLLLRADRATSLEQIVDALWEGEAPPGARGTVRTYVYRLRRVLGTDSPIESVAGGYRLRAAPESVDFGRFKLAIAGARTAEKRGDPGAAAQKLREALECWTGPALMGARGPYLEREREELERLRLAAWEERLTLEVGLDELDAAEEVLGSLVAEHPLRERLRELQMLILARRGRPGEALAVFTEVRRLLREELGADPGERLRRLHQRLLRADPALSAPAATPAAAVPAQIPADQPLFTGRARESVELTGLLTGSGRAAIAGITGLGGMGKTALAIHVAHALAARFPDGSLFADMRAADAPADPHEVLGRFLRAIGVGSVPESLDERSALWRTSLARRRVLVVLDDARDHEQIRHLLPGAPGSAAIVTSVTRMIDLPGVPWIRLGPLLPGDSVRLLGAVAGEDRLRAEPETARRLLDACSHQPLSVHVAAARLLARPHWTLTQIAEQLDDDLRQPVVMHEDCKIVDAPFRRAEALLSTGLLDAFHLCAVPECSALTPAEVAALLDLPPTQATASLESLVDAHVLESGPDGTYHFLPLVKAFARRRARDRLGEVACRAALRRLLRHRLADDSDWDERWRSETLAITAQVGDRTETRQSLLRS